jgi:hypothetical protein
MIHHVSLGTNDVERARRFYDAIFALLGLRSPRSPIIQQRPATPFLFTHLKALGALTQARPSDTVPQIRAVNVGIFACIVHWSVESPVILAVKWHANSHSKESKFTA